MERRIEGEGSNVGQDWGRLVQEVARRLKQRYPWLDADECLSGAGMGLTLASAEFDARRGDEGSLAALGVHRAVDAMRQDGVLQRSGRRMDPAPVQTPDLNSLPAPESPPPDLDRSLVAHPCLSDRERAMLGLYYIDGHTWAETFNALGLGASTGYLARRRAMAKLRWALTWAKREGED